MSPSFDFSLGRELEDGAGRWVLGSVVTTVGGYRFEAHLWRRHASGPVQCHSVRLDVATPFRADDFAAYLRMVSGGEFETVSPVLGLYETKGLDPAAAAAIFDAMALWVDPWEHESLRLLHDLTSLGEKLEQVRKREFLGLAVATVSANRGAATDGGGLSASQGDGK